MKIRESKGFACIARGDQALIRITIAPGKRLDARASWTKSSRRRPSGRTSSKSS